MKSESDFIVPHTVGALTAACGPNGHGGSGLATDKGAEAGHILAFGGNNTAGAIDVATACNAHGGAKGRLDFESETFVTHSLRGEGFDASEDGIVRGTPLVPVAYRLHSVNSNAMLSEGVSNAADATDVARSVDTFGGFAPNQSDNLVAQPLPLSATNRCRPEAGDPCHPLAAGAHAPAIAFQSKQSASAQAPSFDDVSPTLDVAKAGGMAVAQGFHSATEFLPQSSRVYSEAEAAPTLQAAGARMGNRAPQVQAAMQVRRLTPRECERLQGFPDDYTLIPTRRVPAKGQEQARAQAAAGDERFAEIDGVMWVVSADSPRYKALGNSWAVDCVRWLGRRIDAHLRMRAAA